MNYWLHPEARKDLREAAEFYREQAGACRAIVAWRPSRKLPAKGS